MKFRNVLLGATIVVIATVGATLGASAGLVASEGFESPVLNPGGIWYGPDEYSYNTNETGPLSIPDFSFNGFSGIIANSSPYSPQTPFGNQAAFLQTYGGVGSSIDWTLSGLTAGTTYVLSFWERAFTVVPGEPFTVSAAGGSTTLYSPTATWTREYYSFTPGSSTDTIDFATAVLAGNQVTALDNFAVVPEPGTLALLGAGLIGVGFIRRRKNKN